MAGISLEDTKKQSRRPVDSEVNLIPMIDLFVCCIAFLLITAVWTQMSRVDATAQVPGKDEVAEPAVPDRSLHVAVADEEKFSLVWKQGSVVINKIDVPRKAVEVDDGTTRTLKYPELAAAIDREWKMNGSHRDSADRKVDMAVLHAGNTVPYREVIAVMDAIRAPKRAIGPAAAIPAFKISFAVD
jgi:biopolymer transport protein ExbD